MIHKVMIALAIVAFVGCASDAQSRGHDRGPAELGDTHMEGTLTFRGAADHHDHVPLGFWPGSVHVDLGVKGYGCIAHPDYGLYTPHFC
jgi:hypothetical protein